MPQGNALVMILVINTILGFMRSKRKALALSQRPFPVSRISSQSLFAWEIGGDDEKHEVLETHIDLFGRFFANSNESYWGPS